MKPLNRREFLSQSGQAGVVAATTGAALLHGGTTRAQGANNRIVMALIGAGGRGGSHATGFAKLPGVEFKYICDVWDQRAEGVIRDVEKIQGRAPRRVSDMRAILDDPEVNAVVIATPEHWHALATIWACQAGKDVYVEKCPSLSIWEGRQAVRAAEKYKRVVQVGFQNRSAPYAVTAREFIESGKLGRVVLVKVCNLLGGQKFQPKPDGTPPAGFDWDRWLGPAPAVPYNPGRHLSWYDWWDYKGGALVDDGSHQLDLARFVLGNPSHPRSVLCVGGNYGFESQREAPELQAITWDFGKFAMTCDSGNSTNHLRKSNGEERYGKKWPHWPSNAERIEIYGTDRLMYLGRHGIGWQVVEADGKLVAEDKGTHPDVWHRPNFVDCIRSRAKTRSDPEEAHRSATLVHMANISYRVGNRQLVFNAASERFEETSDAATAANALVRGKPRTPYIVPEIS
jgi:predicted dehydrogenase